MTQMQRSPGELQSSCMALFVIVADLAKYVVGGGGFKTI